MSDKCPRCGAAHRKMSMSPGYGYYECGSYDGADGSGWVESHPCTSSQLAASNGRADEAEAKLALVSEWQKENAKYGESGGVVVLPDGRGLVDILADTPEVLVVSEINGALDDSGLPIIMVDLPEGTDVEQAFCVIVTRRNGDNGSGEE